jgi:hypothetical protein
MEKFFIKLFGNYDNLAKAVKILCFVVSYMIKGYYMCLVGIYILIYFFYYTTFYKNSKLN